MPNIFHSLSSLHLKPHTCIMSDFIVSSKESNPTQNSDWSVSYHDLINPIGDAIDRFHQELYNAAKNPLPRSYRMSILKVTTNVATSISVCVKYKLSHKYQKMTAEEFFGIVLEGIYEYSGGYCMYLNSLKDIESCIPLKEEECIKHALEVTQYVMVHLKKETPDLFYHFVKN
jgi:hypothetical protein